jgi:hypothetical protein
MMAMTLARIGRSMKNLDTPLDFFLWQSAANWCPGPEVRHIIPASLLPKISPSPPFDYAQGMLFQRGVKVRRRKFPL